MLSFQSQFARNHSQLATLTTTITRLFLLTSIAKVSVATNQAENAFYHLMASFRVKLLGIRVSLINIKNIIGSKFNPMSFGCFTSR